MDEIMIEEIDGIDIVKYQPVGVCSKFLQLKIKDGIILDSEFIGGCSGNLNGIGMLIKDKNIDEIANKLQGIRCGNKETSCPDQLSKCLKAYIKMKETVKA